MQPDGLIGDRESQANPAGRSAPGVVNAVKGLKNLLECFFRNSGAIVGYTNECLAGVRTLHTLGAHFHGCTRGRVAGRISDYILDGGTQQGRITVDWQLI